MTLRRGSLVALVATALTGVLLGLTVGAAHAARRGRFAQSANPSPNAAPREYTGGSLLYGTAYRAFRDHVGNAFGFDAVGSNAIGTLGVARIRTDITLLYHGNRNQNVPSSQLEAGDQLTLGSTANMFHLLLGPELALPTGEFRPYIFAVGGFGNVYVRQSLDGHINGGVDPYHLDSSHHTSMFSWGAGGGFRIRTNNTVMLDVGAEYRDAIKARLLTPGRISSAAGVVGYSEGSVDAQEIIFRVGFARAR